MSDALPGRPALPHLEEPSDAELISSVRAGDVEAYGTLFARHVDAARRLARQLVSAGDVDDLVSDAFAKVLGVLQRGGGPDLAFRAYLLTSVRRLHVDRLRAGARLHTTDDLTPFDPGVPFEDTAVSGFDNATAAKAFAQLPERWQQVLWHTEVEGQKPADVAPLLGMSPNSVSALAYRAREGLRQAFISMHAQDAADDACATTRASLGAYIRNGISKRDSAKVEAHLGECRECTAIYLELTEVNQSIGALIAPMVLGSAAAAYLGATAAGGATAAASPFLDRVKDWVVNNPAGRILAGAGGAAVLAVAIAVGVQAAGGHDHAGSVATAEPNASAAPSVTAGEPTSPAQPSVDAPLDEPADEPSDEPVTAPLAADPVLADPVLADPIPTEQPTQTPTQDEKGGAPVIRVPVPDVTAAPGTAVVIDLSQGAHDPDGDELAVAKAVVAAPAHGTVSLRDAAARRLSPPVAPLARAGRGTVTYTPGPGWRGTDTIKYVLTDGKGGRVSGSVRVHTPNAAPVALADRITVGAGQSADIVVTANDSDANGDELTVSAADATGSAGGTVSRGAGALRYVPAAGFTGTDTFGYTVSDGHGGTDTATVTVTVDAGPNRAPTAGAVSATTRAGKTVTVTLPAGDADGDQLTVTVDEPEHGRATYDPRTRELRYTADESFAGVEQLGYRVSDGRATTTGTVRITVDPNRLPDVSDESFSIYDTETVRITVPADPDGDDVTVTREPAAHGEVAVAGRTLTYTPRAPYSGSDSFRYTVSDGISSRTVTVRLSVRAVLRLTADHPPTSGYVGNQFVAAGIPAGKTATFRLTIVGFAGWHVYFDTTNGAECGKPTAAGTRVTVACTVVGNGGFLHADFDTVGEWRMDATLVPDGFDAVSSSVRKQG